MSQDKATPTLDADQGTRNLVTRVIAALVLVPVAIAAAYAGGWFGLGLVVLAAIGLYVEWQMIVDAAADARVAAAGAVALLLEGATLASGRIAASLGVVALGVVVVAVLSRTRRGWVSLGLCYASAALIASAMPGISRSSTSPVISGVRSVGVTPVPPVLTTTS